MNDLIVKAVCFEEFLAHVLRCLRLRRSIGLLHKVDREPRRVVVRLCKPTAALNLIYFVRYLLKV